LTFDARWEGSPVWSPDGSTIYFAWDRSGPPDVFSLPAQGGPAPKEIYKASGAWFPTDVSSDGRFLLIDGSGGTGTRKEIWVVPLNGEGDPYAFGATRASKNDGRFSPDGKWIAYASDASADWQIYVEEFPGPGERIQVSLRGGYNPVWAPDGKSLFFQKWATAARSNEIMVVDLATPEDFDNPSPRLLFDTKDSFSGFDVAPDGKRFLLKLVPEDTPPSHVILNWDTETKD
jgi:Tol biopolymer transport system component